VRCTCMVKRPFSTRIDEAVLELAQRLADTERRSVTSLIEVAILEYSERRGASSQSSELPSHGLRSVGPEDEDRAGPEAPAD
jgi:hypothetical protein